MKVLMLMWADRDAAGGDDADLQAWVDFDAEVRAAGAFVLNGALAPAATDAHLVSTAIDGHDRDDPDTVRQRPYADGTRQIQAFSVMDVPDLDTALTWAHQLPTYGLVEVRPLLEF